MNNLSEVWQNIIVDKQKSWVVFENGTCVILMKPEDNLEEQAKKLLSEYGPIHAGSSFGDFSVIKLVDFPGWVVTGHHPDILNYISPTEFENESIQEDLQIGLLGRQYRDEDATTLNVISSTKRLGK